MSITEDHNEDLVPGTEVLLDRATANGDDASLDQRLLLLVPEPNDDPHNPLNWTPTWKAVVIINQAIFVFISVLTPLSIAPLTGIFIHEFDKTLPEVNMLFGAAAIALGYANLIIVPFSNLFGRRPTVIICGLICVLANVWQALAGNYTSFIASRVISGLGAAANESIMPMVIADLMFLHQRGLWMGLYFWSYFLGLFIGPIISGSIAASISWRWFFWVCAIAQGINLIMMMVMFPETRYIGKPTKPAASIVSGTILADKEFSVISINERNEASLTKSRTPESDSIDQSSALPADSTTIAKTHSQQHFPCLGKGRPSREQFSLLLRPQFQDGDLIGRDVLAPFQIFAIPIILWAALSMGFAANCLLGLNLTQSQVFAAPPYNFSSAEVGFVNFAFVVGGIIGLLTAGPVSDFISMRATLRNGGIREPEMRLLALFPYIAICLVGMVITAVGYQNQWSWQVIIIVGYGCIGIEVVSIPALVISYAVDCYKHIPGQIMVTATIVKNTFGFGMIFFFNEWTFTAGFIPPLMMLMGLAVGFTLVGAIVFSIWGKQFRRWTMHSKLHKL